MLCCLDGCINATDHYVESSRWNYNADDADALGDDEEEGDAADNDEGEDDASDQDAEGSRLNESSCHKSSL